MSLKVTFWGVRGSIPSSETPAEWVHHFDFLMHGFFRAGYNSPSDIKKYLHELTTSAVGGFGTNTTCVQVQSGSGNIIIDGGSGIRRLSESIMAGHGEAKGPHHIFLTHFHWDHLIGLPFFTPHFIPGSEVHYYAVQSDLEKLVRGKFQKPYFPVAFESLGAKIVFHKLDPRKTIQLGDMSVTPYQLDHPDECWGFKVQSGGKTYAHCVDTEGTRISQDALGPDLALYQGVDLMYFDAQYTLPELAEKSNWGHSASQIGLDLAFREGIKMVILGHHDPGASIERIYELKDQTRQYYEWRLKTAETNHQAISEVKWRFAQEGFEIDL